MAQSSAARNHPAIHCIDLSGTRTSAVRQLAKAAWVATTKPPRLSGRDGTPGQLTL
jgi:hypothetical protein